MAAATRKSLASRAGAVARKVVAKKAPAKKATPAKKTTKAAVKDAKPVKAAKAAKKTIAKKAAPAKAAKKAPSKAPKKATVQAPKKAPVKAATKAPAKTATKTPAKAATKAPAKAAAKKTPSKAAPAAKKTVTRKTVDSTVKATPAQPAQLVVLEAEDPWTKAELKEVRLQLNADVKRLTGELAEVEGDLAGMIENSGEGAGHDQADVGSASFERDQEMVIVHNARDMLEQSQHALERIANGTYGQCENCGNPIGKNRLMAFPRATLCLSCKQREERR
jgi:RNA polymerase-binding protein DksA